MDTWHWWCGVDNPGFWREMAKLTSKKANVLTARIDLLRMLNTVPRSERWEKDRKSTRLNSSHRTISYAVFCLKKKKKQQKKNITQKRERRLDVTGSRKLSTQKPEGSPAARGQV